MTSDVKKRKDSHTETKSTGVNAKDAAPDTSDEVKPKFGPFPPLRTHRVWARGIMVVGVFIVVYFSSKSNKEVPFATVKDDLDGHFQKVSCSKDYSEEVRQFPGCKPKQCGRFVSDQVISASEVALLLAVAKQGLAVGRPRGGVAILDLHSGAVSYDQGFVNIYKLDAGINIFKDSDFELYRTVKSKIKNAIVSNFEVDTDSLYLTYPTFFSRLTNAAPQTIHDEYWHTHVDKETYEAFHFTSLLYLSNYGSDFQGGRFVFVDKDKVNRTVEPKAGRLSMFTSGSENTHFVERVSAGVRYAITVSFTCNQKHAISDPIIKETISA